MPTGFVFHRAAAASQCANDNVTTASALFEGMHTSKSASFARQHQRVCVCVSVRCLGGNALEAVMSIWLERQAEFVGTYKINLATTALTQLLVCAHPALASLQVPLAPCSM